MANLNALRKRQTMATGPGKKAQKAKSPKAEKKAGKKPQTWDPFMFGGRGATGQEAASLERGPRGGGSSPKVRAGGGAGEEDEGGEEEEVDHQLTQFVPDQSVIGASASE